MVAEYGADTLRLYEMFIGDFEKAAPWSTQSIKGCKRFLDRVWGLADQIVPGEGYRPELESAIHRTIKKVGEDIEVLKHNTAIAAMMSLVNDFYAAGGVTRDEFATLLTLLNPFAPHITEELWQRCGFEGQIAHAAWPVYDEAKCVESTVEVLVQLNGKPKARLNLAAGLDAAATLAAVKAAPEVAALLEGKTLVKEIAVPGKLVNLVVKG